MVPRLGQPVYCSSSCNNPLRRPEVWREEHAHLYRYMLVIWRSFCLLYPGPWHEHSDYVGLFILN
jgi:hypothetical protein